MHLSPTMNFANCSISVKFQIIAIIKTSMKDQAFNISSIEYKKVLAFLVIRINHKMPTNNKKLKVILMRLKSKQLE